MSISFVKYTLQYTLSGTTYTKPVTPKDSGFFLSVEVDDYKRRKKNECRFTFYNDKSNSVSDFDTIRAIELISPLTWCYLIVEKRIGGDYQQIGLMRFSIADCEIDLDRCTASVKPEYEDSYSCVMDDIDTDYNILKEVAVAPPYIIVNPVDIDLFKCRKTYVIPANVPSPGCAEPLTLNWQGGLDYSDAGLTGSAQGLPYDFNSIGGTPTDTYDTHPYYDPKTILAGSCFNTSSFPYSGGWQPVSAIYAKYRVISVAISMDSVNNPVAGYWNVTVEMTWGAETTITLNNPITNAYNTPPGGGWIPFLDIFQGGQPAVVWGREPFYNDQTYIYAHTTSQCNYHEYTLINPYLNNSALRADIYRGRLLTDTIQMYLDKAGCGLTLQSEFLQSNVNPVTGEPNPVYVLNQCSDIKDPDSTEAASFMMYPHKYFLDDLRSMADLRWHISGDKFIIEHIRYYRNGYSYNNSTQAVKDLRGIISQHTGRPEIVRKNRYVYDVGNIYKSESIDPSQYLDYDFARLVISYDVDVIKDEKNLSHQVRIITDVAGVFSEPSAFNSESVVMVAYRSQLINPLNNVYANVVVNELGYRTQAGINGREVTNGWLCISNLFNRFYRDNRMQLTGTIENDLPETFLSETKKILQTVEVSDCDMEIIDDESLLTTELGTGRMVSAKHNVLTSITELQIEI